MFNKKKCAKCRFSMLGSTSGIQSHNNIICARSLVTGETCLKRDGTDIRGKDKDHCLCFESMRSQKPSLHF